MGFRASFTVTTRSLLRSRAFWLLLAAVGAVHWFVPGLVRSDGTDAGALSGDGWSFGLTEGRLELSGAGPVSL